MGIKVLVTGASTLAGRSMIQALQTEGAGVLACDAATSAWGDVPAQRCFAIHEDGAPELVGDLLSLCVRHDVDVVVPMRESDQVALTRNFATFERFGTRVWLAPIPAHITRSVARRVLALARRRRAADAMSALWQRLSGVHSPA